MDAKAEMIRGSETPEAHRISSAYQRRKVSRENKFISIPAMEGCYELPKL
jgi:hypothetical protein